jgi:multidrug transporter EmrE-like cation transporter
MIFHALLLASLLASSHGVLKWVSVQPHDSYFELLFSQWKYILLALMIYGFVFFYYILLLRTSPISSLYPIYTGLSVLAVMLIGRMVFSEAISILHGVGAALILTGIVLMGWNS